MGGNPPILKNSESQQIAKPELVLFLQYQFLYKDRTSLGKTLKKPTGRLFTPKLIYSGVRTTR